MVKILKKSMYDTIPQIELIVANGDGHNRFTFQACSSYSFLKIFFNENPLFFSHFQKLRGRGNIFVFLSIQIFHCKFNYY